ncbi:GNAT family N-acetyltransferase [Amphibiibacter pelophylacis]|uniref:GNAT family N-acetyltransferase n=1 Tax=Amphibiibacter pelophylacis TaxID=1799477 RepID=A0ACC6NZF0_9BURK
MSTDRTDYLITLASDPAQIPAAQWDDLLARQARPTPFMRHAALAAMHHSGSACTDTGWQPAFIALFDAAQPERLRAACPMYIKSHSYGEYVFDWAWANAYARHGLDYYPKALIAVPFTPVPGSRLLADSPADRAALLRVALQVVRRNGMSSLHLLLGDDADRAAVLANQATEASLDEASDAPPTFLLRDGLQFHWQRSDMPGVSDFDDYLSRLQRKKRKNIVQERRQVAQAGAVGTVRLLADLDADELQDLVTCYAHTYHERGNPPYLTPAFFEAMHRDMGRQWLVSQAWLGQPLQRERLLASALLGLDEGPTPRIYGRSWGRHPQHAHLDLPGLHFETCYYQPLEWALANKVSVFEGGAQGEHKMARGFLPVPTWSAHHIVQRDFARAIADFVDREGEAVQDHLDELARRTPLRTDHNKETP